MERKEISELKKKHRSLEKKVKEIGEKQCASAAKLAEALAEIIGDIESTIERDKSLWNPDISTKIKLAKRGIKLSKKLKYFEGDVVKEFEGGNISQDIGKRFIAVIRHLQDNKIADANKEFAYLRDLLELGRNYELSKVEIERMDRSLKKKRQRIEALLKEISQAEKQKIDLDKAQKYVEFLKSMQELEKIRADHISSLVSRPVVSLLDDADSLREYIAGMPGKESIAEIKNFFSGHPELGRHNAGQICGMFDFNEKKLSHVCRDTAGFKRIIKGRRSFFELLRDLRQTKFLEVNDEKTLDFYARENKNAVDRIRFLGKDIISCRNEYERKIEIEERKRELSKYSKDGLEAELKETESLIGFLYSEPEEETPGLFSRIASFFRVKQV